MSHNQAKNWVLSFIYRAAVDFKKSKKKLKPPGPGSFRIIEKNFFKETDTSPREHVKSIFYFIFSHFNKHLEYFFLVNLFESRVGQAVIFINRGSTAHLSTV